MSNEVTMSASVDYEDSENTTGSLSVVDVIKSVSTKRFTRTKQNVGTSEEAINIGDVSAPGYCILVNRDTTNYIEIKTGTGGVIFAKLDPDTNGDGTGGFCVLKLGSGAQAPYAIAHTAACQMDVFIIDT